MKGDVSIERATVTGDGSYYLETKVQKYVDIEEDSSE